MRVHDPRPDLQELLETTAAELAEVLPGDLLSRMAAAPSLEEAVSGVEVVQEDSPERLDVEQDLCVSIEVAAPREALLSPRRRGSCPATPARR